MNLPTLKEYLSNGAIDMLLINTMSQKEKKRQLDFLQCYFDKNIICIFKT